MPFLKPIILVIFLYIGFTFFAFILFTCALEAEVISIKCKFVEN